MVSTTQDELALQLEVIVPVVFNVLKIKIVLKITSISNCIPKNIHDSCTNLVCDQDFEIAMIIRLESVCPGT